MLLTHNSNSVFEALCAWGCVNSAIRLLAKQFYFSTSKHYFIYFNTLLLYHSLLMREENVKVNFCCKFLSK